MADPVPDSDLARLQRKVNLLTTLVLFLVFVELVGILETVFHSWNALTAIGVGVFLVALSRFLASLTS